MRAPLSLEVFPLHPVLAPAAETVTHALARIRAVDVEPRARPELTAILVLDVSGSMLGDPLAHVVHSAQRLTDILAETDRIGVVTFNEGATTVSPPRRLDAQARRDIRRELAAARAGGNTNIGGALAHAALLLPKRAPGERQLLLLMSDGEPNVGAQTPAALEEQARLIKEREVAVSTLGFGANHNDDVLVAVAEGGGGRYAYVVDPKLAEPSFVRALGAQLDVVAEEVRLTLAPAEGVEILRVLDGPPTAFGAGGLRVTLPDLIVGDELNVLVELKVRAPREPSLWTPLRLSLTGRFAGAKDRFEIADTARLTVDRVGPYDTDPTAHAALGIANAAEVRAEARRLAERGSYAAAAAALRKAQAAIAATPGFVAGAEGPLNDAYETLVDEIAVMDQRPAQEEYQRYKKASRDYLDFAHSGAKVRSGGALSVAPPSVHALNAKARTDGKMPVAFLEVVAGPTAGVRIALTKDRFVLGRSGQTNDLVLRDPGVSRQHTMIQLLGDRFWVVDLGATSGTLVNGKRIARAQLAPGDVIALGETRLRYEEE